MSEWMTTKQVADESGRAYDSVKRALARGLLNGSQARAGCSWRISRAAFDAWMQAGCPLDRPTAARLRRAS